MKNRWTTLQAAYRRVRDYPELRRTKDQYPGGLQYQMVPRKGLEPPRSYSLVPETSASTNSATWAFQERERLYQNC